MQYSVAGHLIFQDCMECIWLDIFWFEKTLLSDWVREAYMHRGIAPLVCSMQPMSDGIWTYGSIWDLIIWFMTKCDRIRWYDGLVSGWVWWYWVVCGGRRWDGMVCGDIDGVIEIVLHWKNRMYCLIWENGTDWLTDWVSEKVTTREAIASKNANQVEVWR